MSIIFNKLNILKDGYMRIVCVDDEKLALDYMSQLLKGVKDIEVVGLFQNPEEGYKFIVDEEVDVVFLDIQMPVIDGLQLAELILEKKPHINVVFVTAYDEYAVNAFEINAIDYLLKPAKVDRLEKTIERLRNIINTTEDVDHHNDSEKLLYIQLGKNVSFSLGGEHYSTLKWRTAKARELFLYLLQNHGKFVHKSTLMEVVWGEEELDRGYSILYTTVYNVRKAIQPYADYLQLKNTNDGYILELNNVEIDLHKWEQLLQKLPTEVNENTIKQYIETMEWNSGPYLEEYDYIWVEAEKQRLENLWVYNAEKIAKYYKRTGNFNEAIEYYLKIVNRVPELEEAHFSLMVLFAEQHKYHEVIKQYEDYVKIQEFFGLNPRIYITEWFNKFLIKNKIRDN